MAVRWRHGHGNRPRRHRRVGGGAGRLVGSWRRHFSRARPRHTGGDAFGCRRLLFPRTRPGAHGLQKHGLRDLGRACTGTITFCPRLLRILKLLHQLHEQALHSLNSSLVSGFPLRRLTLLLHQMCKPVLRGMHRLSRRIPRCPLHFIQLLLQLCELLLCNFHGGSRLGFPLGCLVSLVHQASQMVLRSFQGRSLLLLPLSCLASLTHELRELLLCGFRGSPLLGLHLRFCQLCKSTLQGSRSDSMLCLPFN
mmetsp:Transcript_104816/g.337969  ORF Transcript_104816/g.337969 Transcript_104816/m.337969 type:complete len:252 (-) Transcript_104816:634-1389(-)